MDDSTNSDSSLDTHSPCRRLCPSLLPWNRPTTVPPSSDRNLPTSSCSPPATYPNARNSIFNAIRLLTSPSRQGIKPVSYRSLLGDADQQSQTLHSASDPLAESSSPTTSAATVSAASAVPTAATVPATAEDAAVALQRPIARSDDFPGYVYGDYFPLSATPPPSQASAAGYTNQDNSNVSRFKNVHVEAVPPPDVVSEHKSSKSLHNPQKESRSPPSNQKIEVSYVPRGTYSLINRDPQVLTGLHRIPNVASFGRYSSKFLEMKSLQTIQSCYEDAQKTFAHRNEKILNKFISADDFHLVKCMLDIWLVKHTILVLYEHDSQKRKQMALDSFPTHMIGKWCLPEEGDILIVPSRDHTMLLTALRDIIHCLESLHKLPGQYNDGVIPLQKVPNFYRTGSCCIKTDYIKPSHCLKILKVFKPLFKSVYFKLKSPHVRYPKIMLGLEILQLASLALMLLCDDALCKRWAGAALLFAQLNKLCTCYINLLMKEFDLSKEDVYTHVMADWYLSKCYFFIWENEASQNFFMEYERNKVRFKRILTALKGFEKDFDEFTVQTTVHASWQFFFPARQYCANEVEFPIGERPRNYLQSAFRSYVCKTWLNFIQLRNWAESASPWTQNSPLLGTNPTISTRTEPLNRAAMEEDLKTIYQNLQHDTEVTKSVYDSSRYIDVVILNRFLAARCSLQRCVWAFGAMSHIVKENRRASPALEVAVSHSQMALYEKMVELQVQGLFDFSRSYIGSYSVREARLLCCKQILLDQVFMQIDLQDRMKSYKFGLSNLLLALFLSLSPWMTHPYTSTSRTPSISESDNESRNLTFESLAISDATTPNFKYLKITDSVEDTANFRLFMAVFCYGASQLYLLRAADSDLDNGPDANNAIYYHNHCALLMQQEKIALSLLDKLHNHIVLLHYSFANSMEYNRLRSSLCFLKRLVRILPVLWEYCIQHSMTGPVNYNHIMVEEFAIPFTPHQLLHGLSNIDYKLFEELLKSTTIKLPRYIGPCSGKMKLNELDETHTTAVNSIKNALDVIMTVCNIDGKLKQLGKMGEDFVLAIYSIGRANVDGSPAGFLVENLWFVNCKYIGSEVLVYIINGLLPVFENKLNKLDDDSSLEDSEHCSELKIGTVATVVSIICSIISFYGSKRTRESREVLLDETKAKIMRVLACQKRKSYIDSPVEDEEHLPLPTFIEIKDSLDNEFKKITPYDDFERMISDIDKCAFLLVRDVKSIVLNNEKINESRMGMCIGVLLAVLNTVKRTSEQMVNNPIFVAIATSIVRTMANVSKFKPFINTLLEPHGDELPFTIPVFDEEGSNSITEYYVKRSTKHFAAYNEEGCHSQTTPSLLSSSKQNSLFEVKRKTVECKIVDTSELNHIFEKKKFDALSNIEQYLESQELNCQRYKVMFNFKDFTLGIFGDINYTATEIKIDDILSSISQMIVYHLHKIISTLACIIKNDDDSPRLKNIFQFAGLTPNSELLKEVKILNKIVLGHRETLTPGNVVFAIKRVDELFFKSRTSKILRGGF